jgi:uncharacterized protein YkwD
MSYQSDRPDGGGNGPALILLFLTLIVIAVVLYGKGQRGGSSSPATDPRTAELLDLHNRERTKSGAPALKLDSILQSVAQAHAEECAQRDKLTHQGSDGSWPWDRAKRAGYPHGNVSENAGWNYQSPADAVAGWMGSGGHRRNLLNSAYVEAGFGYAEGKSGPYWIAVFGGPGWEHPESLP